MNIQNLINKYYKVIIKIFIIMLIIFLLITSYNIGYIKGVIHTNNKYENVFSVYTKECENVINELQTIKLRDNNKCMEGLLIATQKLYACGYR